MLYRDKIIIVQGKVCYLSHLLQTDSVAIGDWFLVLNWPVSVCYPLYKAWLDINLSPESSVPQWFTRYNLDFPTHQRHDVVNSHLCLAICGFALPRGFLWLQEESYLAEMPGTFSTHRVCMWTGLSHFLTWCRLNWLTNGWGWSTVIGLVCSVNVDLVLVVNRVSLLEWGSFSCTNIFNTSAAFRYSRRSACSGRENRMKLSLWLRRCPF